MKTLDKKQDMLKTTPQDPKKSEDKENIRPEYALKIQKIMKQDRIKIKDIDHYFDE